MIVCTAETLDRIAKENPTLTVLEYVEMLKAQQEEIDIEYEIYLEECWKDYKSNRYDYI